jgi:hypothetical protein
MWADAMEWGVIGNEPFPLSVAPFESGPGEAASLVITPGRVSVIGQIPGMSPSQARRLVGLICRGIAMAEHPPPHPPPPPAPLPPAKPGDNPGDNPGGQ